MGRSISFKFLPDNIPFFQDSILGIRYFRQISELFPIFLAIENYLWLFLSSYFLQILKRLMV